MASYYVNQFLKELWLIYEFLKESKCGQISNYWTQI